MVVALVIKVLVVMVVRVVMQKVVMVVEQVRMDGLVAVVAQNVTLLLTPSPRVSVARVHGSYTVRPAAAQGKLEEEGVLEVSLGEALKGKRVIEFPTVHVTLGSAEAAEAEASERAPEASARPSGLRACMTLMDGAGSGFSACLAMDRQMLAMGTKTGSVQVLDFRRNAA